MLKRRSALALLAGILAVSSAWPQGTTLQAALSEMGVTLNLPEKAEQVPLNGQSDPEYQAAFRFPGGSYEVRISLFPQSWLVRESGGGNVARYVPLFSMGFLAAMTKQGLSCCKTAELPGLTVRKEFGADTGMTALARGNMSDFGRGYAMIAVVFLYKTGKGVAVVSILYNEPKDLDMDGLEFSQAYYCLRFNEGTSGP